MTELISRQAALAEIDKNREELLSSGMTGAEHIIVHYGRRVIEELPTIDVPDRKVGTWEMRKDPYGFFEEIPVCSVCGCTNKWREKYSYCPMCGAIMECEQDG